MSPVLTIRTFNTFVVLLWISSATYGSGETFVSFKELKSRPDEPLHEDSVGVAPNPMASINGGTETSTYALEATFDVTNSTALRTTAKMTVSALPRDDEKNWGLIEARAHATSSLAEIAFVQGTGVGSGVVEFHWTVSGSTTLVLDEIDDIHVESLSGFTTLDSTVHGVLLNEFHTGGTGEYNTVIPVTADSFVVPVPFNVNDPIPVFFDLSSQVDLKIENNGYGKFTADVAAEFGNSAVLDGVLIRDMAGQPMPGATLVSRDGAFTYPIVPEPGCGILMLLGAVAMAVTARNRRRLRTSITLPKTQRMKA